MNQAFPANGDLSASQILQIKLKAEEMWADSQLSQEYVPHADAAIAVLKNQTARFGELTVKDTDNTVKVNFINPCGIGVQDATPSCDLDGQELSTGGIDYAMDIDKETVGFKVNREKFRTNLYGYNEFTAAGMMQHIKALDEFWAQQVLQKLNALAGINVAVASGNRITAGGFTWDAANSTSVIPYDAFNVKLISKLTQQQIVNKMPAGYIIDRGVLFQPIWNSKIDAGNLDGSGDNKRADMIDARITYDQFNFDLAGVIEDMFIVNPGAIAFKTRTRNPDTPTLIGGKVQQTRFTVNSRVLPGVKYDVYYSLECVVNEDTDQDEIVDVWKFKTRGGIFQNPNGCPVTIGGTTYTPNGVLAFRASEA